MTPKVIYFLFSVSILWCLVVYNNPSYNWDGLAYMANVLELDGNDPHDIQTRVYQELKIRATPDQYTDLLIRKDEIKWATDPQLFASHIQQYKLKLGYWLGSYLLYKTGVPLFHAVHLWSLFGMIGIVAVLLLWLKFIPLNNIYLISFGSCLLFSEYVSQLGRLTSPDAFSTFLILLCIYFYYRSYSMQLLILLVLLAMLFRPENILLLLASYFIVPAARKKWVLLVALIGLAILTALSFILLPEVPSYFSMTIYLNSLVQYLKDIRYSPLLLLLPMVAIVWRKCCCPPVWNNIFQVIIIFMLSRLIVHPSFEDRFFVFVGIIGLMFLLEAFALSTVMAEEKPLSPDL